MLRDSYYMMASLTLRFLTTGLLFIVLARVWGVGVFGAFMYPFTISALVALVVDYGFSLQIVRNVARDPDRADEITWDAFSAKVWLALISLAATGVITALLPRGNDVSRLLWLLTAAAIAGSFGLLFNLPFRALGLFNQETRVVMVSNVVHFVLVSGLALAGQGPLVVAAAFVVSRLAYLCLSWRAYSRFVPRSEHQWPGYALVVSTLKKGFPFGIHMALGTLYFQVDTLLIHRFLGAQGVGTYQAGLRVMMAGLMAGEGLTNVYLPRLAVHASNRKALVAVGAGMTRHMLLVGAVGSVMMIALAKPGVGLLYGVGYEPVARLLSLMAIVFFCVISAGHTAPCLRFPTGRVFEPPQ